MYNQNTSHIQASPTKSQSSQGKNYLGNSYYSYATHPLQHSQVTSEYMTGSGSPYGTQHQLSQSRYERNEDQYTVIERKVDQLLLQIDRLESKIKEEIGKIKMAAEMIQEGTDYNEIQMSQRQLQESENKIREYRSKHSELKYELYQLNTQYGYAKSYANSNSCIEHKNIEQNDDEYRRV